jgi:RNA methyltransferase, TrmH family
MANRTACSTMGFELMQSADRLWAELPSAAAIALVLGEERAGLSADLHGLCHAPVRLPMVGRAESLNVAVAAGIVMYELVRQR